MHNDERAARRRIGSLNPLVRYGFTPVRKALIPTVVHDVDRVPQQGPAIIAANHLSFIDSPLLMNVLQRPVLLLGKVEYLDRWATRHLFPAVGMIPIDRTSAKASVQALNQAASALATGSLIGIFPEGTRTRDGMLHKGRTGVARLAVRAACPVIPVGIRGTDRVQPPGSRLPRLRQPCEVLVGEPIDPRRYRRAGASGYRDLTDEIMFEIGQLSGQRYVDRYAEPAVVEADPALPAVPMPRSERDLREPALR